MMHKNFSKRCRLFIFSLGALLFLFGTQAYAQDQNIVVSGDGGPTDLQMPQGGDVTITETIPAATAATTTTTTTDQDNVAPPVDVPLTVTENVKEVTNVNDVVPPKSEELESYKDEIMAVDSSSSAVIAAPSAIAGGQNSEDKAEALREEFFDSSNLVPESKGEMSKETPVMVTPSDQPASKFVTVTKNHSENSQLAKIISAERALSLGLYESAFEMFDALSQKNTKEPRILMGKAVSLQKIGRFDEAMEVYQILSDLQPKNIDVKINMLGLLGTKYPAVALRRLMDLYAQYPENAGVVAQLGISYANAGDVPSAIKYLGIVANMEPQNPSHMYNMAVISDRAGNTKEAIDYYEQALEIDSMNGSNGIPRDAVYERLSHIR